MDWIRAHYDRVAVIAGALFLLVCALLIFKNASQFDANFAALQSAPPPKAASQPPTAAELDAAAEKLRQPAQWTFSGRSGLFVPEKHFIGPTGQPATLQTTEVHPPVPNEWLEQFGLPIAEADVLTQDQDADGFTNLEEWQGRTNPTDKQSRPPYWTKLKLKSFVQEPFRLTFASQMGDTFTLNTLDFKEPTQILHLGDKVQGTSFKVARFEEKRAQNPATGGEVDVSELTLENEETKETLVLVKEKVMISPGSTAKFIYSWEGKPQELSIKTGEEFSLKPQEEIKYKLVDVQPDKAVIVNIQKPNERIEIGLLTQ